MFAPQCELNAKESRNERANEQTNIALAMFALDRQSKTSPHRLRQWI